MPWQLRPHKVCGTAILSIRVHLIRLPEKKVSKSRVTLMAFSNRLNLDIFFKLMVIRTTEIKALSTLIYL